MARGAHAPMAARLRNPLHQGFQRFTLAVAQDLLEHAQRAAETLRLLQHFFAVGDQDIAPNGRIAGGDTGEIPEAGAGQREELFAFRLLRIPVK